MKTIISVFILLFATVIQAEEVTSKKFTDDIMYSVTVEQGMNSQLSMDIFMPLNLGQISLVQLIVPQLQ